MKTSIIKIWLIAIITLLCIEKANAQTNWNITVSNFSFSPANLTIDQGDIVIWNNNLGTHNVNGSTTTFSNNPVSFGNTVQNAPWEYSFTFNVAGEYRFQCDPHSGSMQGTITVNTVTSIDESDKNEEIKIYPSPVSDYLFFEPVDSEFFNYSGVKLFNLNGKMVFGQSLETNERFKIDISHLEPSIYFYQLQNRNGNTVTGKIIKQ